MKKQTELQGIFRAHYKGFGFVKLEDAEEEIYIAKGNTKKAISGDRVSIQLLPSATLGEHKEGKVVQILQHEKDTLVGIFTKSKNFAFVIPDDKNFGTDIYISKKNFGKARNNHKVLVKITQYPGKGVKNAEGKVIEVLGDVNAAGVDMLSLIKEHKLPYQFPEPVVQEARNVPTHITPEEIEKRVDLRDKEIFTIDGEDAKDLDDAVCVDTLENGHYRLGVHIADVSHYVLPGSQLDKEAILRGTSIYMMDRVIPMLPRELSNGICSLNAGEDRLAITVWMEINAQGKVIGSEVQKSVIHVTKRMSYTSVYAILQNDPEETKKYAPYVEHFKRMEELAHILKARREQAGSLDLNVPESKIILNQQGIAVDVQKYQTTFAHEIIEQFMLTANETIAEKFYWLEAPFIYRVHEEPEREKVKELNTFLYNFGYKIKTKEDHIYPSAFAHVLENIKGRSEERVVSNLVLRTLKVARYEAENKGHFGIASKYYCHFTSPIRRYPDLFIHRVISYYLAHDYTMKPTKKEDMQIKAVNYASQSSEREKIAQKVEREAEDIKKAEYMEDKVGEVYTGIVSSVTSFGIFVELENTVEGLIRFEHLGDEYFIYDEQHKLIRGEHTNTTYRIGDKVTIQVIAASKETRQIDFRMVQEECEQ